LSRADDCDGNGILEKKPIIESRIQDSDYGHDDRVYSDAPILGTPSAKDRRSGGILY